MTRMLLVALALAPAALFAQSPSFDGQWDVHATIGGTVTDMSCTFTQKDAELSGTCGTEQEPHALTGKVDGKTITWQFNTQWEGQTLTVIYTGALESAEKLKGTVDVQPLSVSGDFSATRGK